MNKKFELTDETIEYEGKTLYRIRALKDFGDVKKGDLGGFIKKESNLSQEGNCWISDNAKVYDNASICGNTKIYDNAEVYGSAKICGNAILKENQVIDTGCCRVDLSKNLKENIRCQTNLFPQKDCVIAYKQVNKDLTSLYDNTFQYKIDEWIEVENPDMSNAACTTGLHFSNMNYWDRISGNTTYLMAKIMLDDIITVQRGKIRCKRAFIIDKYEIED